MKAKPLWKISVAAAPEAEDAISEALREIFRKSASSFFDCKKQTSLISVYFSERKFLSRDVRKKISESLKRIQNCGLRIGSGKIAIQKIRREDWAESWKRHFKPIEISDALLIKPGWSRRRARKNQAVVVLDPGLSFGTGRHPTTLFCLREIVRRRKIGTRKSFLDIGTGSGILAISAAKLGYKSVRAFDFDPAAVRIARANARANGIFNRLKIARGDATKFSAKSKKQFDLICANLISNLLIAERKRIVAQLSRGGVLVLAGILRSEFLEVQKQFEALGLKLISSKIEKEWRSGSFYFPSK